MLHEIESAPPVSKKQWKAEWEELRVELLQQQRTLGKSQRRLVVVVSGVDGAGKGEVVHLLNELLDPRGTETHAFWRRSDEEEERPYYWRFWRKLPARGRVGILFGSWYTEPISQRAFGKGDKKRFDRALDRIVQFERMLAQDGTHFLKLWFHLSKEQQLKQLPDLKKNPLTHWRVLPLDWTEQKSYERFVDTASAALDKTHRPSAPWTIIESSHERTRNLHMARSLADALRRCNQAECDATVAPEDHPAAGQASVTVLNDVDLSKRLDNGEYRKKLRRVQKRLVDLTWEVHRQGVSVVIVFEGWDAAGKGGCIRRMTQKVDPRLYRVIPIGAPTDEERAHHYLWRFWRHLPRAGMVTIFDRSWYGRVLVERVEGFASTDEWKRAYEEINDFEAQMIESGTVVLKFWLHISKAEQLRRFKRREKIPYKRHKITPEDWRNREEWRPYESAVNDMVAHTHTRQAPWHLIPAEDKRSARVETMERLCKAIRKAIGV